MFSKFNQINRQSKFNDRNFKNYLGGRKYWWFGGQNNKERGETEGKI